jgi:hypothetical protein
MKMETIEEIQKRAETITKDDWESLKRNTEMNLKQNVVATRQFLTLLNLCLTELAQYEEKADVDSAIEEIKEIEGTDELL